MELRHLPPEKDRISGQLIFGQVLTVARLQNGEDRIVGQAVVGIPGVEAVLSLRRRGNGATGEHQAQRGHAESPLNQGFYERVAHRLLRPV